MINKVSAEIVRKVAEFEGFRAKPYKCPAGVWTIGYGHTGADVTEKGINWEGQTLPEITEEHGLELLARDMETAEHEVVKVEQLLGCELWQCEFDALASFVYNVGAGNFRSSSLRKIILTGHPTQAAVCAQFMRWVKAGDKVLPGLVKRRATEAAWYICGEVFVEALGNNVVGNISEWLEKHGAK